MMFCTFSVTKQHTGYEEIFETEGGGKNGKSLVFLDAKIMNYLIECSRFILTKVGGRVKVPTGNLYC